MLRMIFTNNKMVRSPARGVYQLSILCVWVWFYIIPHAAVSQNELRDEEPSDKINQSDSQGIVKISLPITQAIERADLYFWAPSTVKEKAEGILVLVPGRNGNGRGFLEDENWRGYAKKNNLVLCGVSYSSDRRFIEQSYSNAHSGSGKMLLAGIERYLGEEQGKKIPILIYGFSAGARFTASFVEANSERVVAWCAYAVSRWQDARKTISLPPGIVASGEWDAVCYHASLLYFQQGRKLGKPWVWLSLKETGHRWSPQLDGFVKVFFSEALAAREGEAGIAFLDKGSFRDIDSHKELTKKEVEAWPIFSVQLPASKKIQDYWVEIHHP
ncbi:MAG: hypothetical protein L3J79_07985 [Candidatus Marinimicrobia bacterium]|nr:hypothetical protein [Candidatus Neomarinimicrobiota bacterium]